MQIGDIQRGGISIHAAGASPCLCWVLCNFKIFTYAMKWKWYMFAVELVIPSLEDQSNAFHIRYVHATGIDGVTSNLYTFCDLQY
jgi:hypothetical protein